MLGIATLTSYACTHVHQHKASDDSTLGKFLYNNVLNRLLSSSQQNGSNRFNTNSMHAENVTESTPSLQI